MWIQRNNLASAIPADQVLSGRFDADCENPLSWAQPLSGQQLYQGHEYTLANGLATRMIRLVYSGEDRAARYEDKTLWLDQTAIVTVERRRDLLIC
jgi:hypothetical protein